MAQNRHSVWQPAIVAVGLALAVFPASAAERTVIPFEINRFNHMVVEIEINEVASTTGVIDTAATFPMVDSNAALRGGVSAPGLLAEMVNVLGVNGMRDYPVVRLDTVQAGNLVMKSLDAVFNDELEVPGSAVNILPANALPGDVLEIDFDQRTISSYDGKPDKGRSRGSDSLAYLIEDGLIFIDINLNGTRGRALIDTGSSLSFVNSAFAEQASMRRNDELTQLLFGATGKVEEGWIATARNLKIADFVLNRPSFVVSDPLILKELGLSEQPVMVLGLDFLSKFHLQFDRRKQRLRLSLRDEKVGMLSMEFLTEATRLGARR